MKKKNKQLYKELKELYPNVSDSLLKLVIGSHLNLIAGINEEIYLPIKLLSDSKIKDNNDFDYSWKTTI